MFLVWFVSVVGFVICLLGFLTEGKFLFITAGKLVCSTWPVLS